MPKYLVTSGNFQLEIHADEPEEAAGKFVTAWADSRDDEPLGLLTAIVEMVDEVRFINTKSVCQKYNVVFEKRP